MPNETEKPEARSQESDLEAHAILACLLYRVGIHEAKRFSPEQYKKSDFKKLSEGGRAGWLRVAKYVFDNYDLKKGDGK